MYHPRCEFWPYVCAVCLPMWSLRRYLTWKPNAPAFCVGASSGVWSGTSEKLGTKTKQYPELPRCWKLLVVFLVSQLERCDCQGRFCHVYRGTRALYSSDAPRPCCAFADARPLSSNPLSCQTPSCRQVVGLAIGCTSHTPGVISSRKRVPLPGNWRESPRNQTALHCSSFYALTAWSKRLLCVCAATTE